LLILAAPSFGQPRPDLSGEWELVAESQPGNAEYLSPIGLRGFIVHTPQALTLTPAVIKSAPSNLHGKERTFKLDESEVRETGESATGEPFVWVSRVQRVSNSLVITTSHPRGTEQGWQSLTVLSLLGQGELEILQVGPNLWPFGTTHSLRFVYRRRP
jgi:hypothetical protein